jgi:hypothetical protein
MASEHALQGSRKGLAESSLPNAVASQLEKLGVMEQTEFQDCRDIRISSVDEACLSSIQNFQVRIIS